MKAAFYTLGCKVNQYETEYMSELLKNAGFEIVSPKEDADCYIVNSCTVTATADQKTRQSVRRYKRNHKDSIIILTGCMPQAFPEKSEELIEADIIISNNNNDEILDAINEFSITKKRVIRVTKHVNKADFKKCSINEFNERIRAFVKIEDGCDRFCSYCIIPMSRGRVRSKSPEDLKEEIKALGENGIKEIVLVGINLSSYGKGQDFNLLDAVRICNDDQNIDRVRLGSLEPDHITDEIIKGLSEFDKFCPQFHISLQSGCDKTLADMNRHYDTAYYRHIVSEIRNTFDDASITTDVMTGFNDESDEDFNKSLEFIKEIAFEKVHTFPYSERKRTAASRKGDNVPKHVKEERAKTVITEAERIRNDYMQKQVGKTVLVLFENEIKSGVFQGYTKNYIPVRVESKAIKIGEEKAVKITSYNQEQDYCEAVLSE